MYVIVVYDVNVNRLPIVNSFLKRYLFWRQNSVFEGELSVSQIREMTKGLEKIINKKEDSIIIYIIPSKNLVSSNHIGLKKNQQGFYI